MKKSTLLLLFFILQYFCAISQGLKVKLENIPPYIPQTFSCNNSSQIKNVTYAGKKIAIGSFNSSQSNIGIKEGIIMCTGNITSAIGPNNQAGSISDSTTNLNYPGDNDINKILGSSDISKDAAVLEFDFVAQNDELNFKYVFASEEYLEYVHTKYNDIFACLLSGPGISGAYSNNSVNIAVIPGTQTYISVNTLNDSTTSEYFVDNGSGKEGTAQYNDSSVTQFDGFTKLLNAKHPLTIGETYHIKFVIADATDHIYNSAVFIESNAFQKKDFQITKNGSSAILHEGCDTTNIRIQMNDDLFKVGKIGFQVLGTALNGTDYTISSDSVSIDSTTGRGNITIKAIEDYAMETPESIVLAFQTSLCTLDSIKIPIIDLTFTPVKSSYEICQSDTILLSTNSTKEGNVLWNTGETSDQILVTTPGVYYYHIYSICGVQTDTIEIIQKLYCQGKETAEFSVWPNPSSTYINLLTDGTPFLIRIVSTTGNIVKEVSSTTKENTIDISDLEAGFYFVQYSNVKTFYSKKFIKIN